MPFALTEDNPLFCTQTQQDDTDNLSIEDLLEPIDPQLEDSQDPSPYQHNDATLPAVPDLPPTKTARSYQHNDATLPAIPDLPPTKTARSRMKMKDQGIRANKLYFLNEAALSKFGSSIPDDFMLDGCIDRLPNNKAKQPNFLISWALETITLPIKLQSGDLLTSIFKGDQELMNGLKSARKAFDLFHPGLLKAPKTKKPKLSSTKRQSKQSRPAHVPQAREEVRVALASLRTATQLNSPTRTPPPRISSHLARDIGTGEDGQSVSDEGSECPSANPDDDLPDDSYDPVFMEEDGNPDPNGSNYADLMSKINFHYTELNEPLVPPDDMYDGEGPCLKPRVARKFGTVLECASVCGGLSYSFFKRLTCNSNQYARTHQVCGKFVSYSWVNITVEEMIRFHGLILKMSVDGRNLGGYQAYFIEKHQVNAGTNYYIELDGFPAWAAKVMTLQRFKQIRAAFHPEVGVSDIGDKCHQLRYAIDKLNLTSSRTFIPGKDLSFDEGGVASRSRRNPVRQYNKDKPNKFRVDFFILSNNSDKWYFIIHIDVYQGKNAANIGVPEELKTMPTTQKAVVNAILTSKLENEPNGKRRMFMDNRYSSAALFILIREQCQILCAGTTRKNRIGWPTDQMDLTKNMDRGLSKLLYDHVNKVVVSQWVDNKVVACTSTLEVSGRVPVDRRSGNDILHLTVEKSLKYYQEGMGGVDRGDQYRELGAGFATKAHYKKWYKKAFFAVLDFMLLNSFFAWNMAAEDPVLNRFRLPKDKYYAALAEEMCLYKDDGNNLDDEDDATNAAADIRRRNLSMHVPLRANTKERPYCRVCKLEETLRKSVGLRYEKDGNSRHQKGMAVCSCESCGLHAHSIIMNIDRKIFRLEVFENMTCFDIAHSDECIGLWKETLHHRHNRRKKYVPLCEVWPHRKSSKLLPARRI